MKAAELAEHGRGEYEQDSADQHSSSRTHDLRLGQTQLARENRGQRPTDRAHDQGKRTRAFDRSVAEAYGTADQDGYSGKTYHKRDSQARGEPLRAQDENLSERGEDRNGGEHDRSNPGGDALLGPEDQSVIHQEDEYCQQGRGCPFAAGR